MESELTRMADPIPSIGRTVHFVDTVDRHCAAVITRVWSSYVVNLMVFPDAGLPYPYTSSLLDETAEKQNSWHWPEPMPPSL